MLLLLTMPLLGPPMSTAQVEAIHAAVCSELNPGTRFADVKVDLGGAVMHDCPPVTFYRIILRERAWLRRLAIAPGGHVAAGAPMAWFSTDREEPLDGNPGRPARITVAAILHQTDWWQGASG